MGLGTDCAGVDAGYGTSYGVQELGTGYELETRDVRGTGLGLENKDWSGVQAWGRRIRTGYGVRD